jgi:hypothetical protein
MRMNPRKFQSSAMTSFEERKYFLKLVKITLMTLDVFSSQIFLVALIEIVEYVK